MQFSLFSIFQSSKWPKTQVDAIVHFIALMDIEMIGKCLDDNKEYRGVSKREFLEKLSDVFDEFIKDGDKELKVFSGVCFFCVFAAKGFTFVAPRSGMYFNIVFKMKEGRVADIHECHSLYNDAVIPRLRSRVEIIPFEIF